MAVTQTEFAIILAAIQHIESARKVDPVYLIDRHCSTQARVFDPGSELKYILYNIQKNSDGKDSLVLKTESKFSDMQQIVAKESKSLEAAAREYFRDKILPGSIKQLLQNFFRTSVNKDLQLVDGVSNRFINEILKPIFDDLHAKFKETYPQVSPGFLLDQTKYLITAVMMNSISAEENIPQVIKKMISTSFNDFLKAIIFFYSEKSILDKIPHDKKIVQTIFTENVRFSDSVQNLEENFFDSKFKFLLASMEFDSSFRGLLDGRRHQVAKHLLKWHKDILSGMFTSARDIAVLDAAYIKYTQDLQCVVLEMGSDFEEHPSIHNIQSSPKFLSSSVSSTAKPTFDPLSSFFADASSQQCFLNSFSNTPATSSDRGLLGDGSPSSSSDLRARSAESKPFNVVQSIIKPLSFVRRVLSSGTPQSSLVMSARLSSKG